MASNTAFNPETAENHPDIEKQWAVKAMHQSETYFTLISNYNPSNLKLTKLDDQIYTQFSTAFPEILSTISSLLIDEHFKSSAAKEKWRLFLKDFEHVSDHNFGTLLRINSNDEYTDENCFFVTRMQFYCIEISRNKLGMNDVHYKK